METMFFLILPETRFPKPDSRKRTESFSMPLYDYECVKCAHVFEVFHKLSEEGTDYPCPKCGAAKSRKLVSQFKTDTWSKFLDTMERKVNPHKFK